MTSDLTPAADASSAPVPAVQDRDPAVNAAAVGMLLLSAAFLGAAGAFVQLAAPPWGLIGALAATAALQVALALLGYGRVLRLAVAGAWLLGAVSTASWRRGHDLVLPDDWRARAYLYGGALLVLALVAVPARGGRSPASEGPPSGR